jgi:hypothetical protein
MHGCFPECAFEPWTFPGAYGATGMWRPVPETEDPPAKFDWRCPDIYFDKEAPPSPSRTRSGRADGTDKDHCLDPTDNFLAPEDLGVHRAVVGDGQNGLPRCFIQWCDSTPHGVFNILDRSRTEFGHAWDPWEATSKVEVFQFRQWVSTSLHSWAETQATNRFRTICGEDGTEVSIEFRHIPQALTAQDALTILKQAGVLFDSRSEKMATFRLTKSKSGKVVVNELIATCMVNTALGELWGGTTRIDDKRICCSRVKACPSHELAQNNRLRIVSPVSQEQLLRFELWIATMQALGLDEFDIKELILASFHQHHMNAGQGWDCQIWHPSQLKTIQQTWKGSASVRGQIRLIQWNSNVRPQRMTGEHDTLKEMHALETEPRHEGTLSLRECGLCHPHQRMEWCENLQVRMHFTTPSPESILEGNSAVCIKVLQIQGKAEQDQPLHFSNTACRQAADIATLIQQRHAPNGMNFTEHDFECWLQGKKGQGLHGILILKRRQPASHDADIITMAALALLIGGCPQLPFTNWCPVGRMVGYSICGVAAVSARTHYHSLARRELQIGFRRKGMQVWNMSNPRDGTIRRLQALLRMKANSADLLCRLQFKSPRWERKHGAKMGPWVSSEHTPRNAPSQKEKGWPPGPPL